MNRVRNILSITALAMFFILCQSHGSTKIWRQVDDENFWADPANWPANSIWSDIFKKHREKVTLQLERLGISAKSPIYYICDIIRPGKGENFFLDFPPGITPSPFYWVKDICFRRRIPIFSYPHDTTDEERGHDSTHMDGFFKRCYDPKNDAIEREFRRLNITGGGGFYDGCGFVILAFFPAHDGHDNRAVLFRYRIWAPESMRNKYIAGCRVHLDDRSWLEHLDEYLDTAVFFQENTEFWDATRARIVEEKASP